MWSTSRCDYTRESRPARPGLNERRERGTRRKPMTASQHDKAARFRALHQAPGAFVIPNPWDAGSARILAGLGFQALVTASRAAAGVLGRRHGTVPREAGLAHARASVAAIGPPVSA